MDAQLQEFETLDRIRARCSSVIHEEIARAQRSWLEIGERLNEARDTYTSNQEFGAWCDRQEFGLGQPALFRMKTAYLEYSVHELNHGRKLLDYLSWSRLAALKDDQKAKVLARLESIEKPTQQMVIGIINEIRGPVAKRPRYTYQGHGND